MIIKLLLNAQQFASLSTFVAGKENEMVHPHADNALWRDNGATVRQLQVVKIMTARNSDQGMNVALDIPEVLFDNKNLTWLTPLTYLVKMTSAIGYFPPDAGLLPKR